MLEQIRLLWVIKVYVINGKFIALWKTAVFIGSSTEEINIPFYENTH